VPDPKDYRYGGYAAALVGAQAIRKGLESFLELKEWPTEAAEYRRWLFVIGGSANGSGKKAQGSLYLFVSILQRLGIEADRFTSSTGTMRGWNLSECNSASSVHLGHA